MAKDRKALLDSLLARRILVLDGAMGSMVRRHKRGEQEFRGDLFASHAPELRDNNDLLSLTRPDVIAGIHDDYLAAGADIVETNTFSSNAISQSDYGLEAFCYELNVAGARLAREAADA